MLKLTKSDQKKGTLPNRKVIPRRRSKKGFTLIELLAVIVVLAIILLIATPIILNVINDARIGAFASSKKNIERAAELYYASNSGKVKFENEISYVEIGTLIEEGYLKEGITNALTKSKLDTSTKVLIYKSGRNIEFSLQMYDEVFLNWYKEEMIKATKKLKKEPVEDSIEVSLEELMNSKEVSELRLPIDLENRCVGYVEITKVNNKNEYQAYVDCLTESSSFASHYVSYGGKYLDEFNDVKETSDGGFIAVGRSNSEVITKYGTGNNGKYDAIIVKFNSKGEVEWSRNFGGSNDDIFNAVAEGPNGYVAVGQTASNDGDIEDYKGGDSDALIVSYDFNGNVKYKRSYGSSGNSEEFKDLLIDNNKIITAGQLWVRMDGDLSELPNPNGDYYMAVNVIFDIELNFQNINWFGGTAEDNFTKLLMTGDNKYVSVGRTFSVNGNLTGIKCVTSSRAAEGLIIKHDINGNIEKIKTICSSGMIQINDVIEVNDGYIVIGYTTGNDYDIEGLSKANNGHNDAIIVKYDKNLENILWKKSFGGSNSDIFNSIVKVNNNEAVVVGYSKSNDMDMEDISKSENGYSNGVLIKYNIINGNIIDKKVFGGSSSEIFTSVVKTTNNHLILSGGSYSIDKDLKNFNKGHQDAIIVKYDKNLKLEKTLEEQAVLIEKIKKIKPNYGTSLSLKYDNIYTANNPERDLKGWCGATGNPYGINNYDYGQCLKPMNPDDMKLITAIEKPAVYKEMFAGEREYIIDNEPDSPTNWYQIFFRPINSGSVNISNFKIKFDDGYVGSIRESVDDGYLEPLVVVSNILTYPPYDERVYKKPIDIIETNGIIIDSTYPVFYINFKSKEKKIKSLIFTTNKDITGTAGGFNVHELRNFDMSITPTN